MDAKMSFRRRQTAMQIIEGYNDWTIDAIMAPRAPHCTHQILPSTLHKPILNNMSYAAFFSTMIPLFRNFHVKMHDIFEDAKENKVAIYATSTADTPIGPYVNEYLLMIYLSDDCTKAVRILEWVDSALSSTFFPRLKEHLMGHGNGQVKKKEEEEEYM